MATRAETAQRKQALLDELREFHRSGRFRAGAPVPSVRELSLQFNLSKRVVSQQLEVLASEGVLNVVPGVGTFFGRPRSDAFEFYLLVLPRPVGQTNARDFYAMLQMGFDDRIAQLGGTSLTMTREAALSSLERDELPPLAGVFNFAQNSQLRGWPRVAGVPQVCFEGMIENPDSSDIVGFDNEGGGRLATGHLLRAGHQRVAFLAAHSDETAGQIAWSAQRESGWRATLSEAGVDARGLLWQPGAIQAARVAEHYGNHQLVAQQIAAAHLGPRGLEAQGEAVSAVVAFNDAAAMGVLAALRAARVPHDRWPALVGFDNAPGADGQVLTSLRLPWEEIGAHAAELLWERAHGELSGAPIHRIAAMRLLPRLTCRQAWSRNAAHAALATAA